MAPTKFAASLILTFGVLMLSTRGANAVVFKTDENCICTVAKKTDVAPFHTPMFCGADLGPECFKHKVYWCDVVGQKPKGHTFCIDKPCVKFGQMGLCAKASYFENLRNGTAEKCEECYMTGDHTKFTDAQKEVLGNSYLAGEGEINHNATSLKLMKRIGTTDNFEE